MLIIYYLFLCAFNLSHVMLLQSVVDAVKPHHNRFTALFRGHPGKPVPEENFWTLWCKRRLTEADTLTIRRSATPSGLTSAHLHHPPYFFTGRMPLLPPNQQCQSTEGKNLLSQTWQNLSEVSFMGHQKRVG